jgi:hypothetical protein
LLDAAEAALGKLPPGGPGPAREIAKFRENLSLISVL